MKNLLTALELCRDRFSSFNRYPFHIPAIAGLSTLRFASGLSAASGRPVFACASCFGIKTLLTEHFGSGMTRAAVDSGILFFAQKTRCNASILSKNIR